MSLYVTVAYSQQYSEVGGGTLVLNVKNSNLTVGLFKIIFIDTFMKSL